MKTPFLDILLLSGAPMRLFSSIKLVTLAALCAVSGFAQSSEAPEGSTSVLFVVSSEGKEGGKERPGFEMDELAQAWSIFNANGVHTAFASPRGGPAEADKFKMADPAIVELLADPNAANALAETLPLDQVDPSRFDAIYVVGGKGAMFDLATNEVLSTLISQMYEDGKVIAAICHGSAALVNVRLASGRYLVDGRSVTGFTAEEEAIFGKKWIQSFPFQIEDALRQRGAIWQEASLMMPGVAVDDRLVTGQNPYSTALVANAVLRSLGIQPIARRPRKDEASLALIELAVRGEASAAAAIGAAPHEYQPELIAIIGHYQLQAATDDKQVTDALAAMDLAAPHYQANELSVSRANALWRLGRTAEAGTILSTVLAKEPNMAEALKLKEKLQQRQ